MIQANCAATAHQIASPGEHEIAYAYPSSPDAQAFGFMKDGCYTVATGQTKVAYATSDEAIGYAKSHGTLPGRWSIDHPLNSGNSPVQSMKPESDASLI